MERLRSYYSAVFAIPIAIMAFVILGASVASIVRGEATSPAIGLAAVSGLAIVFTFVMVITEDRVQREKEATAARASLATPPLVEIRYVTPEGLRVIVQLPSQALGKEEPAEREATEKLIKDIVAEVALSLSRCLSHREGSVFVLNAMHHALTELRLKLSLRGL